MRKWKLSQILNSPIKSATTAVTLAMSQLCLLHSQSFPQSVYPPVSPPPYSGPRSYRCLKWCSLLGTHFKFDFAKLLPSNNFEIRIVSKTQTWLGQVMVGSMDDVLELSLWREESKVKYPNIINKGIGLYENSWGSLSTEIAYKARGICYHILSYTQLKYKQRIIGSTKCLNALRKFVVFIKS